MKTSLTKTAYNFHKVFNILSKFEDNIVTAFELKTDNDSIIFDFYDGREKEFVEIKEEFLNNNLEVRVINNQIIVYL